ncbi:MAG: GHKL domain-containing protein [Planctomycetes bacterium]|nr:GHKL domain-containing protein [Planctomycetota bacterium]
MKINTKIFLLIVAAAMLICSAPAQPTASQDSRGHVLILNSYHKEFKWTDNQVTGAREVLVADVENLELYVEYMDTKRVYTKEYLEHLTHTYHHKYDNIKLDAIITTDDNALRFVMDHHQDVFQNAPVAFCGINDYAGFSFAGEEQFTGLVEVLDIKATIDLALKLHPATRKVYVVVDSTPTGIGQLADVTGVASQYEKLEFEYLKGQDYSTAELLEQLKQLPKDSIVLLTVWMRDKNNDYASIDEMGPLISNLSSVPVYGITDMYLGHGIVGGKLLNSETHGRLAAERIVRILHGEKASNIPILIESQNPYMFDEAQLQCWNIDQADLPKDSIVIKRSFSLYQTYRIQIWSIAAAFVVLLAIIALLVANITKRKKAEAKQAESETRYRELVDNMSSGVAVYEAVENGMDFIFKDLNSAGERIDRTKKEDVVGKKITEMFPGIEEFGLLDVFRKVYKTGEPQHHPVAMYKDDRYSAWFDNYVYKLPSGEIVAVHDDVTERKQAEQQREKLFVTVEAQNQQLIASQQQLRASNQQLSANEQQLRASNRQTNALNQQLIASQQELGLKNEELQSIVYISSHDLKTPLVNINGFSELLNEHCEEMKELLNKCDADGDTKKEITSLLNEDIATDLEYIGTSAQRMRRLIEGLLQVSRIGTVEIKTQKINMNDVAGEIINNVKYKTQNLDAEIVLDNLPDCTGDKHQITQVFTNLIDNALKYLSPDRKGRIKITGKTKNNESVYCVEDNGMGIKPAYQDKIFEIYHRLNPRALAEGDGLGLTIVRRILNRHKGTIRVESEPEKGTKFFVAIPAEE